MKYCVDLMTAGKWVTGRSGPEVAKRFDVSPETVKEWATSASRIIRLALDEDGAREAIRARMVATLDRVVALSMRGKKVVTFRDGIGKDTETRSEVWDAPELGAAVSAISEQAKILGLSVQTHKVDMTVRQYEELSPAAMRERLLDQRARIDEALAKLDADEDAVAPVTGALERWRATTDAATEAIKKAYPSELIYNGIDSKFSSAARVTAVGGCDGSNVVKLDDPSAASTFGPPRPLPPPELPCAYCGWTLTHEPGCEGAKA